MKREKLDIRVLYVEDDADTREAVSEMLQRRISALYLGENGRQGLELFKKYGPDLIISDLRMPLMDGLEMFKAIRGIDEKVPIIVTSAYSDIDYFMKSIELGVTQYVLKPIDRDQFLAAIERSAHQVELEKRVIAQNATIRKLSQAVEQSPEMIIIADFEGKAEYINPKFTEFTGFSLEEIQEGRFGFYGDEMRTDAIQSVLEAIKNEGGWKGERLTKNKDGIEYWEMRTISPLRDEEGNLINYLIVIQDITERKKLEADLYKAKNELELRVAERTVELLKINERLKLEIDERKKAEAKSLEIYEQNLQLLSSITSIVIGVSKDGLVFQWNQVAEKTFGISAADVIGRPFSECRINWNWKEVLDKIHICREKQESVYLDEIRYQRSDGSEGLLELTVNPIGKQKDCNISIFLIGTDIMDRKKSEAKKALSQKLESLGQLAAGIAHEINTPIQYVGDNLHFIKESFCKLEKLIEANEQLVKANQSGDSNLDFVAKLDNLARTLDWPYLKIEIPKAIEQSLEGVARVTKIVQAMKDFSHPSQGVKVSVDLNQALESTITISKNEWKYIADLITDFDPELPAVECIIDEINQVVLNMIINAVDAIKGTNPGPEKGKIMIKTRNEKDLVEITISDTGVGMPPEILAKIFDPFFTTKEVGKGTGQGLTLAHDIIVNKHKGSIVVESEQGKGTTFRIFLPIKEAPVKGESK